MRDAPRRESLERERDRPEQAGMLTSDIPEEWRAGRFVTLTVGGDVDMRETHPTEANPEARG